MSTQNQEVTLYESDGLPSILLAFFALAVTYFLLTVISIIRSCKLGYLKVEQSSVRYFYLVLTTYCAVRLVTYGITCGVYMSKAYRVQYLTDQEFQQIQELSELPENQNYWLPVEAYDNQGLIEAPNSLYVLLTMPESIILIAYSVLFWQLFSLYRKSSPIIMRDGIGAKSSKEIFFIVVTVFTLVQIMLILLYLFRVFEAQVLAIEMIVLNFFTPTLILFLMLWFQCRLSGSPIHQDYKDRSRLLNIAVIIWSFARFCAGWAGFYQSRLFLAMTMSIQSPSYDDFFLPASYLTSVIIVDCVPIIVVLDWEFIIRVNGKQLTDKEQDLMEPLYDDSKIMGSISQSGLYNDVTKPQSYERNSRDLYTPMSGYQDQQSELSSFNPLFDDQILTPQQQAPQPSPRYQGVSDARNSMHELSSQQSRNPLTISEQDFSLYEQFNKGEKSRALGPLYKVKLLREDDAMGLYQKATPMIARVINFQRVQPYVIDQIFKEAKQLTKFKSENLLPFEGICFNEKSSVMHILMPQKISLYEYLHESGLSLGRQDKFNIAQNIAKAMLQLHLTHSPPCHTHLSSKNILLNPSDMHIYVTDYNLKSLKKFCKMFGKYQNVSAWSSPEAWQQPKADFYEQTSIDSYSFGVMLWELETCRVPFEGLDQRMLKTKLIEEKLRPKIPEETDENLKTLIRRCWQENAQLRPNFTKIVNYLDKVTFSD